MVLDLIDDTIRSWKVTIVKDTFTETDADKILRIPLASIEHEIWWYGGVRLLVSIRSKEDTNFCLIIQLSLLLSNYRR